MTDSYEEHLDCGHPIEECYNGSIELNDQNNGLKFEMGGSMSLAGPKGSAKITYSSAGDNTNQTIVLELADNPKEADVVGCDVSDCDNYHAKKANQLKDKLRSRANEITGSQDQENDQVKRQPPYIPPGKFGPVPINASHRSVLLNPTDRDDEHTNQDDPTHITIDPSEPTGDPYQHTHSTGRSISLDSENETDSDQAEVDNSAATTPTTDESAENETNDGMSPGMDESQDDDSSSASAEDPESTTIRASSDDDIGMSLGDEGVSLAFADSQPDTDGTTVQVSADKDIDFSTDDGNKILTLDEAERAATVHALSNDNIGMGFDENDIHMNFGDDGDLHVSSSADTVDMTRTNNRDVTLELGDSHSPEITDTPEQETEKDNPAINQDSPVNNSEGHHVTETDTNGQQNAPDDSQPEQDTEQPSATASDEPSPETNPGGSNESGVHATATSSDQETDEGGEHETDTAVNNWDEEPASTTGSPNANQSSNGLPDWDEEPASTTGPPDADQSNEGLPDWDEEPASSTENHETENEGIDTTNDSHDRDTSNDDWADGGLN
jgi:hypothetical protein